MRLVERLGLAAAVSAAALTVFAAAGIAVADDGAYGAVALDSKTGFVAFAYGMDTEDEALDKVKAECASQNASCDTTAPVHNACVSLARSGDDKAYGISVHATRAESQERAVAECSSNGGTGCNVHDTYCSPEGLDQ